MRWDDDRRNGDSDQNLGRVDVHSAVRRGVRKAGDL